MQIRIGSKKRIEHAAKEAPRPYYLVVLSDHGQSQGATFLDRYGTSLEDVVREACATDSIHVDKRGSNEAAGYLGASLTEVGSADNAVGRTIRVATKGKRVDGAVQLGEKSREETAKLREAAQEGETPELSVMASGCLGLISFPRELGQLTLERIERLYPKLVPALREHPGIGFMLVKRVKPPERTIAQANQTVTEVKTAAQQALAAAKAPQIEGEVVRERRALR